MVIVEKLHIDNIPLLHVVNQEYKEKKTPFVIFVHGFTSAKENNLHYAYFLAEKGFRVVLPEALFHGERSDTDEVTDLSLKFWQIVINEINELEIIKNYFEENNLINSEQIGVAGTSMGGITTLGALTQYEWIKAAVSLMGSPCYTAFLTRQLQALKQNGVKLPLTEQDIETQKSKLAKFDLSLHKDKLAKRPLLFWHGERDQVVPFGPTYQFYKEIIPMYADHPERLKFIADAKADHKVSQEGVQALVNWFDRYLR
ncbi:prolyl oligopeptidase family serine peptidase [Metabacillus malikii]|uniref:Fermentation-respiration switch protein FrsA (DUF1100 family) n=1 Tax=Metabacillus malikii TaxID=1504265 RepID=A0ABT9ZKH0_9BACI|nr:prolyl oligopeptidase family serine peptidase [Metabacillus malikii]MDQ0232281.1 fermentation-respiration switch protein FrsA (DUF1100 family) [Metabacillus malikii]